MDVNYLVGQDNLFYEDCIVAGNSRVLGYHRADNRILTDELITVDESDLASLGYLFSEDIGGITYAGGEAAEHGSYGFFLKKTGDIVNWALMSLESNPFVKVETGGDEVRFLSTSGETWVVPGDDITKVFVETGNWHDVQPGSDRTRGR